MIVSVLAHVPPREEFTHDDRHERDRVFKTRTIIDWLWVAMNT